MEIFIKLRLKILMDIIKYTNIFTIIIKIVYKFLHVLEFRKIKITFWSI